MTDKPVTVDRLCCLGMLLDQCGLLGLSREHTAYVLATVRHETGGELLPVEEVGRGNGMPYGKAINGRVYYGRGHVQITWQVNYDKFRKYLEDVLGIDRNGRWDIDLVNNPDAALIPYISSIICVHGMARGMFTGYELSRYGDGETFDAVGARRVVNGTDRARLIADHYQRILRVI